MKWKGGGSNVVKKARWEVHAFVICLNAGVSHELDSVVFNNKVFN